MIQYTSTRLASGRGACRRTPGTVGRSPPPLASTSRGERALTPLEVTLRDWIAPLLLLLSSSSSSPPSSSDEKNQRPDTRAAAPQTAAHVQKYTMKAARSFEFGSSPARVVIHRRDEKMPLMLVPLARLCVLRLDVGLVPWPARPNIAPCARASATAATATRERRAGREVTRGARNRETA